MLDSLPASVQEADRSRGGCPHVLCRSRPALGSASITARSITTIPQVHEVVFNDSRESPALKLAKCRELGIEVFYDDREDVCAILNRNGILAMRVARRDGSAHDLDAEIAAP